MSWQSYVDTNLVGSGKVSSAAILGAKGGVWAISSGFNLAPEEQKAIIEIWNNKDAALASGVRISGQKYFALSVDDKSLIGKKGGDGCVIAKTVQGILVTVYKAPIQGQEAASVVIALADYLISVGY